MIIFLNIIQVNGLNIYRINQLNMQTFQLVNAQITQWKFSIDISIKNVMEKV
jgi:hypothetical protein